MFFMMDFKRRGWLTTRISEVIWVSNTYVALSKGSAFYTLESLGRGRIPCQVTTIADLDRARDALGYRLLSRWSIPDRTTEAPTAKSKQLIESIGDACTNKVIAEEASPGIDMDTSLSPGF
jgi:hypothetical protein